MRMLRLFTGPDGRSHFEDLALPEGAGPGEVVALELLPVSAAVFRRGTRAPRRGQTPWQTAPRRQYVITLAGRVEIEVGDGSKRVLGPGDILLAEDTEGQGHRVRDVGDETRVAVSLHIAGGEGR